MCKIRAVRQELHTLPRLKSVWYAVYSHLNVIFVFGAFLPLSCCSLEREIGFPTTVIIGSCDIAYDVFIFSYVIIVYYMQKISLFRWDFSSPDR